MRTLFTSESVTEGHPDKICDQISDGILDALLAIDPNSRCACETTAEPGAVHIMGEITTAATVNYIEIARRIIREIGYTKPEYGFDADTCEISCSLHTQSADIAQGVDMALEAKEAIDTDGLGAGDQGMMFGFACDETPERMPLPITLAHRITRRLAAVRKNGELSYLRPDGKAQVTVEYENGKPVRVNTVVLSTQHDEDADPLTLRQDMIERVIKPCIPAEMLDDETKYYINPTGRFVLGGPAADTGLTGRKIIVDTYGGYARHGGGAFSGKDATKVDRSAAYMARNIAKTIVEAGAAHRCEIQLSYAIGVARPVSIYVETAGTNTIPEAEIFRWIERNYDLRPAGIIKKLGLRAPVFAKTAAYGHFGRDDAEFSWEKCDPKALAELKAMVDEFIAKGGTYVDTAFVYHDGASETALREALVERYPRNAYTLATKCLAWACASKEEAQACLPTSLERLGVDYIDYYLLHNLGGARTVKFDEYDMWNYVAKAKADGLVRHVGFSMHDGPETLDEILTAHLEVDFVQLQVNYLDWDDPVTQSARCMEVAAAHGKPVIIMEPVRGGRLANLPERGAAVLAAADPDASQASWAYRYCLDLPGVLTVLAGASTLEQMQDNMRTFQTRKPLMDEERSAIDGAIAALRSVDLIPCTNCGYCVKDCPEGVKIPIAMNLLNLERTTEDNEFVKGLYSWQAAEGPASKCIQCGTCEAMCPQSIDIIDHLAEAVEHFEG